MPDGKQQSGITPRSRKMFKVNRKALETELALLQTVAEKKGTMPILSTVLFSFDGEMLTLTGTDVDTTLVTTIPASGEEWSGCIPSRQLYDLSRLLYGDEINFVPGDGRVTIKLGRSSHKLPSFSVSDFPLPKVPQVEFVALNGAKLSKAIERALRCVTSDAKEHWMQGVSLRSHDGNLSVTATNSRHLASTAIETALNVDLLLPVKAATALVKFLDGETEAGASENQVIFRQGAKTFTARLMDAKFPDWRPLVPGHFKHTLFLDPETSQQAFRLVSVTARETAMIALPFRLSVNSSEMEIQTEETERGKSSETITIDCPTLNGNTLSRGVNGQHFITFFDEDQKTVMSFNDDMRIIQLTYEGDPDYRYITMALKA